jgi:hypothetical protein
VLLFRMARSTRATGFIVGWTALGAGRGISQDPVLGPVRDNGVGGAVRRAVEEPLMAQLVIRATQSEPVFDPDQGLAVLQPGVSEGQQERQEVAIGRGRDVERSTEAERGQPEGVGD